MLLNLLSVIVFSAIWVIAEIRLIIIDKKHQKGSLKRDGSTRIFNIISVIIGLSTPAIFIVFPLLQQAFIDSKVLFAIGICIAGFGIAFRQYSIFVLGEYFRTTVEVNKNHKVIQSGPYKIVRHPSYSGFIVFFIGYGLLSQNIVCTLITFLPSVFALLYRINIEEKEMERVIGDEYRNYAKTTKRLIPFVW